MSRRILLFSLLCVFAFAWSPAAVRAATVILHPLDDSLLTQTGGAVVGFCDDPNAETIDIVVNGKSAVAELLEGAFVFEAEWAEGPNEVRAGGARVKFTVDPYATSPREPSVHQAMIDNCAHCHVMGAENSLKLRDSLEGVCRGCHKKQAKVFSHGGNKCAICHFPHTSRDPKLLRIPPAELCADCHAEKTRSKDKDPHASVWKDLPCGRCHASGHAPAADEKKPLCIGCHKAVGATVKGHAEFVARSCQKCHWMHSADRGRGHWKKPEQSCYGCHPAKPFAPHNEAISRCGECHGIHAEKKKPERDAPFCVGCHAKFVDKKRLHGPEATGNCGVCHPIHDLGNRSPAVFSCVQCHGMENLQSGHTGSILGFGTCVYCHSLHGSDEAMFLPAHQHGPFKNRDCNACHSRPGFGSDRRLKGGWQEFCTGCHDAMKGIAAHFSPESGQCKACHVPHASDRPGLLREEPEKLCLGCHKKIVEVWSPASKHAAEGGCLKCHDPHKGKGKALLGFDVAKGCRACHLDPTLGPGGVPPAYVHGPMNLGECSGCHDWHADGSGGHLQQGGAGLCGRCHELPKGTPVKADGPKLHAPVAEGKCRSCHAPHAADNPQFLRKGGNEICLKCHDLKNHRHSTVGQPRIGGIRIPPGWPKSGKSLACRGCHAGHQSPWPGLLVKPKDQLCVACHE